MARQEERGFRGGTLAALFGVLLIALVAGIGWIFLGNPEETPHPPALLPDGPISTPVPEEPPEWTLDPEADRDEEPRPFPTAPEPDWALAMQAFYKVERVVVCTLDPPGLEALGAVSVGDEPEDRLDTVIRSGEVFFRVFEQEGSGVLMVPGYVPVSIAWSDAHHGRFGRCEPETVVLHPGRAIVRGIVTHAHVGGDPLVSVHGCGNWTLLGEDDTFEMEVVPEPCRVHAVRSDGMLPSVSEPVAVEPILDGFVDVELHLPPWRTGGFGFVFQMGEQGVQVLEVLEDSAAEAAGLESGDVVVAIDGVPAVEMGMEEFREMAIGEEGTEAEFVVDREGERRTLTLERRFIPEETP